MLLVHTKCSMRRRPRGMPFRVSLLSGRANIPGEPMTDDERLAFDVLEALNIAVLRRTGAGEYEFFGKAPVFYQLLFPTADGRPCAAPWDVSPMLEYFHGEAEEFFALDEVGTIGSGVWTEDGFPDENAAFFATAANMGELKAIVVRLLREEYAERVNTLRTAREQLLENRQLSRNLSFFKEKSRIDGLTRIFNKTTFMDLLTDEIKRCRIIEYQLWLLVLDIDDFKKVNDAYGHLVGDKILRSVGETLKNELRRNDVIGRYGGEEFVVLIPNATADEALRIAEKLRSSFAALEVPDAPGITVSIGCASYACDESPEGFFNRADAALYAAKKSGKNRVCAG